MFPVLHERERRVVKKDYKAEKKSLLLLLPLYTATIVGSTVLRENLTLHFNIINRISNKKKLILLLY